MLPGHGPGEGRGVGVGRRLLKTISDHVVFIEINGGQEENGALSILCEDSRCALFRRRRRRCCPIVRPSPVPSSIAT